MLQDKKSVRREQAEQDANNKDGHDDFETLNGSNANDDDEEWSTDVTAEAVKKRMEDLTLGNLLCKDDEEKCYCLNSCRRKRAHYG